MSPYPMMDDALPSHAPPSFEECVDSRISPQADFVISPLALAELFAWDEEEEYC